MMFSGTRLRKGCHMNIVQIYRHVIKFFERHKLFISPQHKRYLKRARREFGFENDSHLCHIARAPRGARMK